MISHKARRLYGEAVTYIQHSAPISHGNSGGPLLDEYGRVIGINTASFEDGQNLNLAIPVSYIGTLDYTNPMTVEEFGARFSYVPSDDLLTVAYGSEYRIEYDDYYYEYAGCSEASVGFVLVNLSGGYIYVDLYDFAVNNVNLNYYYVSSGSCLVEPHSTSYVEITVEDYLTPGGFELTPIGICEFSYDVYAYDSDGDPYIIDVGETDFYYESIMYDMIWSPSYDYNFYDYSDADFDYGMYDTAAETWDYTNDAMASYFFFRNTTDHTLVVNIEVVSVNDRSLGGRGPDNYFTVYSFNSAVPYFYLYYDFQNGDGDLNDVGIKPADIYKIGYNLIVFDVTEGEAIYSDSWTINVA